MLCRQRTLQRQFDSRLANYEKRGNSVAGAALQQKNFVSIVSNGTSGLCDEIQKYDGDSTFGIAECSSIFNNSCAAVPAVNNMYAVAVDGEIENFEAIERWCKNPFPVNSSEDLLLAMLCVNSSDNKLALIKKYSPPSKVSRLLLLRKRR